MPPLRIWQIWIDIGFFYDCNGEEDTTSLCFYGGKKRYGSWPFWVDRFHII